MTAQDSGDVERARVYNIAGAAARLLERAAAAPTGRAALTPVPSVGAALQQTLLAFRGCSWPTMTLLGQPHCRSCGAGCGW
jgi:hypothetical protein